MQKNADQFSTFASVSFLKVCGVFCLSKWKTNFVNILVFQHILLLSEKIVDNFSNKIFFITNSVLSYFGICSVLFENYKNSGQNCRSCFFEQEGKIV